MTAMADDSRPEPCRECGASGGRPCQDLFHELLERAYAAGPAVYGLAVACYTLQHPVPHRSKTVEWAYLQIHAAVTHGLPLDAPRQAARAHFDRRHGQPHIPRGVTGPRPATWRMDVTQVVAGLPTGDAERILEWASAILQDVLHEHTCMTRPDGSAATDQFIPHKTTNKTQGD